MKIVRTVKELKNLVSEHKKNGKSIGLVPTMGALHEGHLSLISRSRKENDVVVVSVFVNPTQFNNKEDLIKYPRTEKEDLEKLKSEDVDIAFLPSVEEVYPEEDTRQFDLGTVAEVMEGKMRPGHFNGVAQIVSKLFEWAAPTRAYFGEKDFQQIRVIKKMSQLEGFDITIVECPIKREIDGLAMSSRNVRLTPEQRMIAPEIHRILTESVEEKKRGLKPADIIDNVIKKINAHPFLETEYYEIVDSETLLPVTDFSVYNGNESYPVGCITVYCGDVRLIDNIKYL
ncbi:MAG: pantoate--beta-alanine ligase [Muribaculaceae bacterium]|nr:pantoate--beta-alanine ligase [Muribaculaceae bacterium]